MFRVFLFCLRCLTGYNGLYPYFEFTNDFFKASAISLFYVWNGGLVNWYSLTANELWTKSSVIVTLYSFIWCDSWIMSKMASTYSYMKSFAGWKQQIQAKYDCTVVRKSNYSRNVTKILNICICVQLHSYLIFVENKCQGCPPLYKSNEGLVMLKIRGTSSNFSLK